MSSLHALYKLLMSYYNASTKLLFGIDKSDVHSDKVHLLTLRKLF